MNLLTLANNPGEITRRGAGHEKDSVIDLAWYNDAAIQDATFAGLEVDWAGSLGSDHAMLCIAGYPYETPAPVYNNDLGYVVDPEMEEEWIDAFKAISILHHHHHHHLHQTPTPEEAKRATEMLTDDIQRANKKVLRRRHPPHPRAAPWWTADCAAATQMLREAADPEQRKIAHARLRVTRSKQRSVGCKAPTLVRCFECLVASASVSSEDDDIHSSLQGVFIPGRSLGD